MRAILFSVLVCPLFGLAQVGIGTTGIENASAKLEVKASGKGFLPPRVSLTSISDVTTIPTPATGLLIYNTATAGTGIYAVTPGFYYYDGSKWQRLINQQPDATVSFDSDMPSTATTFTGGPAANTNYIYVSETNNSQWTYNGTTYVTYTPPATTPSTPWLLSTGTSDAGSNKTSSIYRSGKVAIGGSNSPNATLDLRTSPTSTTNPGAGFLGVGTTSATAASAGAGAISYSTSMGGTLQYSDGSSWNTVSSISKKTVVTGHFTVNTSYTTSGGKTLSCTELTDNTNAFSSGTFTVPRTGMYLVTAHLAADLRSWTAGEQFTVTFNYDNNSTGSITSGFFSTAAASNYGTASISAVVSLVAGKTATFTTCCNVFTTLNSISYNRFSITEL